MTIFMRVLVGLLLLTVPAVAREATPHSVLRAAVVEVIQPGFAQFAEHSGRLETAMAALCAEPGAEQFTTAQGAFGDVVEAWGRVEWLRLGPLGENNRAERILFWPDRRGIGLRQVQEIVTSEDATATDPQTLADKSVAVQGLGALEYVLFGTGSAELQGEGGAFRCRFGHAIAQGIEGLATEIAAAWDAPDGIAVHLTNPQPQYRDYRDTTEALEALVGTLSHGVEGVRDTRLNPVLGAEGGGPKPKQALFWRSGLTVRSLAANMAGLHLLLRASRVAQPVPEQFLGLENSIDFEFRNAFRALDLLDKPIEEAVADPKQLQALRYLVIVSQSLQDQLGEQLPTALSLSVGFSSLDGD